MNRVLLPIVFFITILALAAGAYVAYISPGNPQPVVQDTENQQPTTTPVTPPATQDSVSIAVLDTAGETNGPSRGCDRVVLIERDVEATTAPLRAALEALFSIESEDVGGYFNFIARTNDTLEFDRVEIENGTAHIYLEGSLTGMAGICDDPRASIQIEETALQFPTVDDVVLYLNGEETTLVPSQQ